jgi:hypothetical protein
MTRKHNEAEADPTPAAALAVVPDAPRYQPHEFPIPDVGNMIGTPYHETHGTLLSKAQIVALAAIANAADKAHLRSVIRVDAYVDRTYVVATDERMIAAICFRVSLEEQRVRTALGYAYVGKTSKHTLNLSVADLVNATKICPMGITVAAAEHPDPIGWAKTGSASFVQRVAIHAPRVNAEFPDHWHNVVRSVEATRGVLDHQPFIPDVDVRPDGVVRHAVGSPAGFDPKILTRAIDVVEATGKRSASNPRNAIVIFPATHPHDPIAITTPPTRHLHEGAPMAVVLVAPIRL